MNSTWKLGVFSEYFCLKLKNKKDCTQDWGGGYQIF